MAQILSKIRKLSPELENMGRICRTAPHRDEDPTTSELKERLDRIDKASSGTVKTARSYYETNRKINIIIVSIGIILLANSIVYTWVKGTPDYWSVFSGGLGIAAFVTIFFTKPQENITKALGNLAQVQMICKSYCLQFDILLDYYLNNEIHDIGELTKMNLAIQKSTHKAVKLIQSDIEKYVQEERKEKATKETITLVKAQGESVVRQ